MYREWKQYLVNILVISELTWLLLVEIDYLQVMINTRKTLILSGKSYPCIEILYKYREKVQQQLGICIACYVTLPKIYHYVGCEYGDCLKISNRPYSGIIYSFLILLVESRKDSRPIIAELVNAKILKIE